MSGGYSAAAAAWAAGPERVYALLAAALVDAAPLPVPCARVLDLGAGTGVAGRAALAAGAASVVALDNAVGMLRWAGPSLRPVLASAEALPFGASSFDLVLAAAALSHVPDPVRALREARRVGRGLAVSAFAAGWSHPAKPAVDSALSAVGYRPPAWYLTLKSAGETRVDDPALLADLATRAGYRDVTVRTVEVATGVDSPSELVAWRLGMAHVAPFVASLPADGRAELRRIAESALAGAAPLVVPLIVLAAT